MHVKSYAVVVAVAASLVAAGAADARTFRVTKTGDPAPGACTPGDCSLREAVLAANNNSAGRDAIVLPNRRRPYRLTIANGVPVGEDGGLEGDLDVTNDPLSIVHRGRGRATIDQRSELDRVIDAYATLTLKRIGITGGDSDVDGAGIAVDGGGIRSDSPLRLVRSSVFRNDGQDGGGLYLRDLGTLTMKRSALLRNHSDDDAGAVTIAGDPSSALNLIARSRVVANSAGSPGASTEHGGAIDLSTGGSRLTIRQSTFAENRTVVEGGAIYSDNPDQITITGSTFSGNSSVDEGGALFLDESTARIVNSTFSGNRTAAGGGAIFANLADVSLNGVTVVRNRANTDSAPFSETGGGLANSSSAFSVRNSVIALNRLGPGGGNNCTGDPFSSGGGNLLSTLGPADVCAGFDAPKDKVRGNPKLGALAKNGGPTKTVSLKRGSAAIGNARSSAPDRDQRGRKRDRNPDSGAFERGD